MKKIISLLLAAAIAFSSLAFAVSASSDFKPYEDSRYFTYGDYEIHYRVIPAKGEMKGRIMMLHGFLCSTYAWRNLSSALAEQGYECTLADIPSFGFSTRESEDVEFTEREKLITELMKSIAPVEEWIIAGHSMGGGVAINIAEEQPVKALLLYCPCPQNTFPEAAKGIILSKPMKALMNGFFNIGTRFSPIVKLVIYAATNDWNFSMKYDVSGVTDAVQYDGFGAGLCEMMYKVRPTDLEGVDKITCPVLLCQATNDIILNDSMKKSVNSAFPDAEFYEVRGGGHQCIENRYEELCEVTTEFLK